MVRVLRERVEELAGSYEHKELAVLGIAREVAAKTLIDDTAVSSIAEACGVDAELVSDLFASYPDLGEERCGAGLCTDLTCYLRGASTLLDRLRDDPGCLGSEFEGISPVSCLGLCFQAPVLRDREGNFHRLDPGSVSQDMS